MPKTFRPTALAPVAGPPARKSPNTPLKPEARLAETDHAHQKRLRGRVRRPQYQRRSPRVPPATADYPSCPEPDSAENTSVPESAVCRLNSNSSIMCSSISNVSSSRRTALAPRDRTSTLVFPHSSRPRSVATRSFASADSCLRSEEHAAPSPWIASCTTSASGVCSTCLLMTGDDIHGMDQAGDGHVGCTESVNDDSHGLDARHARGHAMHHAAYKQSWKPVLVCGIGVAVWAIYCRYFVVFGS